MSVTERVRHLHGLLAPFVPIGEFASSVLRPEALGLENRSQFYEPISFGVHVTGRANNSKGCMRIAVPVHGNEQNWLPTMQARFARMINKPDIKVDFRTVTGRPLESFTIEELPHVGRLHAYVNGEKLSLPSMPAVATEYSSKKPEYLAKWISKVSFDLPDFIGSQFAGLPGDAIDNAMVAGGSFEKAIAQKIMSSVPDWTEFVRIHNSNSPLSMTKEAAQSVASHIASNVRDQMEMLFEAAHSQVAKHLRSMEHKRTQNNLQGTQKRLFSNVESAADAERDHGNDLFCRLGDDLVASPNFYHAMMDNVYSRPLPINGCRWQTEPPFITDRKKGGKDTIAEIKKRGKKKMERKASGDPKKLAAGLYKELNVPTIFDVDDIIKIVRKWLSGIQFVKVSINDDVTRNKVLVILYTADLFGFSLDHESSPNMDDLILRFAKMYFSNVQTKLKKNTKVDDELAAVLARYPKMKMFFEIDQIFKWGENGFLGILETYIPLMDALHEKEPTDFDAFFRYMEAFTKDTKTIFQKIKGQVKAVLDAAYAVYQWWSTGNYDSVNQLDMYVLRLFAVFFYGIDVRKAYTNDELQRLVYSEHHKAYNDMRKERNAFMAELKTKSKSLLEESTELSKKAKKKQAREKFKEANAVGMWPVLSDDEELEEARESASAALLESEETWKTEADQSTEDYKTGKARVPGAESEKPGVEGSSSGSSSGDSSYNPEEEGGGDEDDSYEATGETEEPPSSAVLKSKGKSEALFKDKPAARKDPVDVWRGMTETKIYEKLREDESFTNDDIIAIVKAGRKNLLIDTTKSRLTVSVMKKIADAIGIKYDYPDDLENLSSREKSEIRKDLAKLISAKLRLFMPTDSHHPLNALIHSTLEPKMGEYPAYYKLLHTKENLTASAPYSGDVDETYHTYHALMGVPLDMQPGVFISCHAGKKDKKKESGYPDYRYERNDAPLVEPPAMDMPALIPIRSRSPVRGVGAAPSLVPIEASYRKKKKHHEPTYEQMEMELPKLVPIACHSDDKKKKKQTYMESELPKLVPIAKPWEAPSHHDFPDVDDIF